MKYLDEYRDARLARTVIQEIVRRLTRPWTIMEVCGGQTHSIVKHGLDHLLPPAIELVHGPGCPVCVTSLAMLDKAHSIAAHPDVIFCSFGDMLRVPGSHTDLLRLKAQGADVRVVYSPLDCLKIAQNHPDRYIVFFAIGFETTAPANAMTVWQARQLGLNNFALLVSHVRVPPAMEAILQSPQNRVQGFLGPGHVCTVMGYQEYEDVCARYHVPIVVTGFEPLDILEGVLRVVQQLEAGRAAVANQYSRAVTRLGNRAAHDVMGKVFEVCDQTWRGIGLIPQSGYRLREAFHAYDAARLFAVEAVATQESTVCISGQILKGLKKPQECPVFATMCTPQRPLGATMVSAEGACAAYYAYGRYLADGGDSRSSPLQTEESMASGG